MRTIPLLLVTVAVLGASTASALEPADLQGRWIITAMGGQATADDLAETAQIGIDRVPGLSAAVGDTEASHHLIQDQQGSVLLRKVS